MTMLDDAIRREVVLQRIATSLVRELVTPTAQKVAQEVGKMLIGYEDLTQREKDKLVSSIEKYVRENWSEIWVGYGASIGEVMESEGTYQAELYTDYTDTLFDEPETLPPSNLVMSVGGQASTWDDFTKNNTRDTVRAVSGVVRTGIRDGQTVSEMTSVLRGKYNRRTKKYEGGLITGRQAKRAETLVRTGFSHHTNAARDQFAKQNSDLIGERVFFATLDSRTTTICMSNHLRRWAIDDTTYPKLPLHYNERSIYLFTTDGFDPSKEERAVEFGLSEDGESDFEMVSGKLTADQWLRRQPRWFVEESLGKGKAELFISGGLEISSMVDVQNNPLSLSEIKATTAGARAQRKVERSK